LSLQFIYALWKINKIDLRTFEPLTTKKFMKKFIAIVAFLSFTLCASAQLPIDWTRSFKARGKNADRIKDLEVTPTGEIIVAGYSGGAGGRYDVFVMKYGVAGDTLWEYRYDALPFWDDEVNDVSIDALGNVYVTGRVTTSPNFLRQCVTIKLNDQGVQQWVKTYIPPTGESEGNSIVADANGNVYVLGYVDPVSAGTDILTLCYNSIGNLVWSDTMNGPGNSDDVGNRIIIASNGNPTICGKIFYTLANGYFNFYVKQYSPTGATVWEDTYSDPTINFTDEAKDLIELPNGNILVAGETTNNTGFNRDPMLISYTAAGVRNWVSIVTTVGGGDEFTEGIDVDASGNAYIVSNDYNKVLLQKINTSGTVQWRKNWNGPLTSGLDVSFDLDVDTNGDVYTIARGVYPGPDYYGNGGLAKLVIAKYNTLGDSLWTYITPENTSASMGFAITVQDGKVYGGGFATDSAENDENMYTVILDTAGTVLNRYFYNGSGESITRGQFVRTDAQNNVYCAATISQIDYSGYNVIVVKYDPLGNLLWNTYYTTPGWNNDSLTNFVLDPSGNPLLSISSDSATTNTKYKISLVKMNSNGAVLDTGWFVGQTGNAFVTSMAIRNDGSIITGENISSLGGVITKWDANLNVQWTALLDSTPFAATSIAEVALFNNQDIGVLGTSQPGSGTTSKMVFQRYDALGNRLLSVDIDSLNTADKAYGFAINASDYVAVTGSSGVLSATTLLNGNTGSQLWRTVYNPTGGPEKGKKVRFTVGGTPINNVVIICEGSNGSVSQYHTIQYNGNTGAQMWAKVYGPVPSDRTPVDLIAGPTGRIITAGWEVVTGSTNLNYVLLGYDSNGNQQYLNTYTSPNLNPDQLKSMAIDQLNSVIVTGESAGSFYNNFLYRMVTIKYGYNLTGLGDALNSNTNVNAYPNPVNDLLTISNPQNQFSNITMLDVCGRVVLNENLQGEIFQTNVSGFPNGIYFLRMNNDSKAVTLKVIVQH
jgi:hypothetical protein